MKLGDIEKIQILEEGLEFVLNSDDLTDNGLVVTKYKKEGEQAYLLDSSPVIQILGKNVGSSLNDFLVAKKINTKLPQKLVYLGSEGSGLQTKHKWDVVKPA